MSRFASFILASALVSLTAHAADPSASIDKQREEALNQAELRDIPDPNTVRSLAKQIFALPLAQQNADELLRLAKMANAYANFVGMIHKEYDSYHRENFRYEFVQKEVAPAQNAYVKIGNEFKDIRNKAYISLGHKAKGDGKTLLALLYFNDAYRLSTFDCGKDNQERCMRLQAEKEMQKLLAIEGVKPYVTWQKK